MWMKRIFWVLPLALAFICGAVADRVLGAHPYANFSNAREESDRAGIQRLHDLDTRITTLNDAKALQAEWANDSVRLEADGPVDIGKAAIYASDLKAFANPPGFAILSYKPDIRNVQIAGDWAFEWGVFSAGYRSTPGDPVKEVQGKLLRVLHREPDNEWKFARVMAVLDTH
jgi:ketosteroid isomerase-like protein